MIKFGKNGVKLEELSLGDILPFSKRDEEVIRVDMEDMQVTTIRNRKSQEEMVLYDSINGRIYPQSIGRIITSELKLEGVYFNE